MPTYYKLLNADGSPSNGGKGKYSLPKKLDNGEWQPGEWTKKIKCLSLCAQGYHVVEFAHLLEWRGELLCEAEVKGKSVQDERKSAHEQIRLVRVIEAWNQTNLVKFAADCAERVLPIFEKSYPGDDRPRKAIDAARIYPANAATNAAHAAQ